jgi:hypothetical protein
MAYRCSKCGFYWDWSILAPHACPKCHEVAAFKPCEREKGLRGRQPTPDGWICPKCRKPEKLFHRGVCEKCHEELTALELEHAPPSKTSEHKRGRPLGKVSQESSVKETPTQETQVAEPPVVRTEPWACDECGEMWGADVEKCRVCNPYCEGCKEYKPLYKGTLCKSCYDKYANNNKEVKQNPQAEPLPIENSLSKFQEDLQSIEASELPSPKLSSKPSLPPTKRLQGPKKPRAPKKLIREEKIEKPLVDDLIIVPVELTQFQMECLTDLVDKAKRYSSVAEVIRAAVRDLIYKEFNFNPLASKEKSKTS